MERIALIENQEQTLGVGRFTNLPVGIPDEILNWCVQNLQPAVCNLLRCRRNFEWFAAVITRWYLPALPPPIFNGPRPSRSLLWSGLPSSTLVQQRYCADGRRSQQFCRSTIQSRLGNEAGHEVTEDQFKLILLCHHLARFLTFALALGSVLTGATSPAPTEGYFDKSWPLLGIEKVK